MVEELLARVVGCEGDVVLRTGDLTAFSPGLLSRACREVVVLLLGDVGTELFVSCSVPFLTPFSLTSRCSEVDFTRPLVGGDCGREPSLVERNVSPWSSSARSVLITLFSFSGSSFEASSSTTVSASDSFWDSSAGWSPLVMGGCDVGCMS